ncbi:MAG: CaiB/BaiF CoA transferase family protein [Desertimonas sp.]
MTTALPLEGLRVIDMSNGRAGACGRFLADLGAEVILVEPPEGADSRRRHRAGEVGLDFATSHANKLGVTIDLRTDADRDVLRRLLATADVWIETSAPGTLDAYGLGPADVLARVPHLVIASMTDFGQRGPRAHHVASDWVHMASSGILSRSGSPKREPLMPPAALAETSAAIQGAWSILVAYWNRLITQRGEHLDISIHETVAQVIDPPLGSIGTAAAVRRDGRRHRDRSTFQPYPIFRCADGYVRIVVLSSRQWRSLRAWLGEPAELADPQLENLHRRYAAFREVVPVIARFFADRPAMELVAAGQAHGVPIAPVLSIGEVLDCEHFLTRGAIADCEIAPGVTGRVPTGYVDIDGRRAGVRHRAPRLGEHQLLLESLDPVEPKVTDASSCPAVPPRRALNGLRVLDLGVIVMGAEAGRLFADQGAEVIKVENRAYPDGSRAALPAPMTDRFAIAQRGKLGLGVDLRTVAGRDLFLQLVSSSDVVLSNFKPGTIEELGIGPDVLRSVNPAVVVVTSSAMGETGPWRDWMGYGPLVRCTSGLTSLWRYADDEVGFGDSSTIYPDHLAARVADAAALACLIARHGHRKGAHVALAQSEAILMALAPELLAESLHPGSSRPHGNVVADEAGTGVYPCSGDDAWCVITIGDDEDWAGLCGVITEPAWLGGPELRRAERRLRQRDEIASAISAWTTLHAPDEVERLLQAAGVPAAAMRHLAEIVDDEQLRSRGSLRTATHPHLDDAVRMENGPFLAPGILDPELRPAPLLGEHTRYVARELLKMSEAEIDEAVGAGVLQVPETA